MRGEDKLHKVVLKHGTHTHLPCAYTITTTKTTTIIINNLLKVFKMILQNVSSKTLSMKLSVVLCTFNPALGRQRQSNFGEFKVSLVYILSSRTAIEETRDPVSKTKQKKKKNNSNKKLLVILYSQNTIAKAKPQQLIMTSLKSSNDSYFKYSSS